MGYGGETYKIDCSRGGLVHSKNLDLIPPFAMVHPTKNLNLNLGIREPRGGTSHVYGAAFSGSPEILSGYDFILRNKTQFIVTATNDGKIYKDDTNTIKTGLANDKIVDFGVFDGKLYMVNGADIPQTWDGVDAATSDLGVSGIAVPSVPTLTNLNRVISATGLAIGSTKPNVSNIAFSFYLGDSSYNQDVDAVGTALSGSSTPKAKYGAWRLEVGGDNTVDIIEASGNITGYDDAASAVSGLPALSANHVSMGTVTVSKSDAVFIPGTTDLDAANTTVAYIDGHEIGKVNNGTHSYKTTFINIHGETIGSTASSVATVRNIPGALVGALAGAGAGNVDDGTHSYKVTFLAFTGAEERETEGGTVSNVITIADKSADGQVSLTSIPLGVPNTTKRKLYRTVTGDTGNYKLLTTLSDNTTTTYTDNTADSGLGADIPTTSGYGEKLYLTAIETGVSVVTSRKLYRRVAGDTGDYKLVTTISDNTTTTYTDNVADADLGVSAPTTNTAATRPIDWTGTNQPSWIVVHARGNSKRLVAGGCPTNPNIIYFSTASDAEDFTTGLQTITIDTINGDGIVGGTSYAGRLILYGTQEPFILNDSDVANPTNWGYGTAPWTGGVAHSRLLVTVPAGVSPAGVICMSGGGAIYNVITAQEFGDYKAADLTTPAFINEWIKEYVDLSKIAQFHSVYDPYIRAVRFFVVRKGQIKVDTNLVFYIDRPLYEAWMVHDNQVSVSGHKARSSFIVQKSTGNFRVYTGDYSGFVWELETVNKNDNSYAFKCEMRTPHLSFDNPRTGKNYANIWVVCVPKGSYNLLLDYWVDAIQQTQKTISLTGAGGILGSFLLGTDVLGGGELINKVVSLGIDGERIQFGLSMNTANQNFGISQLLADFELRDKKLS